jgi:membrane protease YdiL (CAAX protease family)
VQLLCALAVIGPYYGLAILSGVKVLQDGVSPVPGLVELLAQSLLLPLVFGGLALALHMLVCREPLASLQPRQGSIWLDLVYGFGVFTLLIGAIIVLGLIINPGNKEAIVPEAVRGMAEAALEDPRYLLTLFGPVFWLQAALLEELTRAYFLIRLWRAFPKAPMWPAVVFSSLLFGAAHLYEGAAGVAGTTLIGLVLGFAYLRLGRLLPVVLAHGLYNSLVLSVMLITLKYGLV